MTLPTGRRQLERRGWLVGVLVLAAGASPQTARAQLFFNPFVFDFGRWSAMAKMLIDVKAVTDNLQATLQHVQNAARSLGGGNLVDDILLAHRRLTADVHAISYSIETVTTQFRAVFPSEEAARNVAPQDVDAVRQGWDRELHQSALAASRAQSALTTIERNTSSARDILERSKESSGSADEGSRLAKLQALVQMLGVINSDMTTLATAIAASERVTADTAAAEVSDESLDEARAERMMRDYTTQEPIPQLEAPVLR